MNLKRRIPQYILGLILMAVGVVFLKKLQLGISPISSVPDAISNVTPFTLGNVTIAFHIVCIIAMIIVMRRVTIKTLLTLPLAIAFGYLIDLCMFLMDFQLQSLWLRLLLCFPGIVVSALGVVLIVGADLMLPSPDQLFRAISATFNIPLSRVKVTGDIIWVATSVTIDLVFNGALSSVGIGTVLTALLVGKFIGVFNKYWPGLNMPPFEFERKKDN